MSCVLFRPLSSALPCLALRCVALRLIAGKEVVTRWSTNLATSGTWYTDSNGREMRRRVRDHRATWKYEVTTAQYHRHTTIATTTATRNTHVTPPSLPRQQHATLTSHRHRYHDSNTQHSRHSIGIVAWVAWSWYVTCYHGAMVCHVLLWRDGMSHATMA